MSVTTGPGWAQRLQGLVGFLDRSARCEREHRAILGRGIGDRPGQQLVQGLVGEREEHHDLVGLAVLEDLRLDVHGLVYHLSCHLFSMGPRPDYRGPGCWATRPRFA